MDPLDMLKSMDLIGQRSTEFGNALAGMYVIGLTIGTIGILISIIICGIKIAGTRSSSTREEAKNELFLKIFLGVLLFAFTGIISLLYGIAKKFIPA